MKFPRKPFLDHLMVQVIPIEEIYEQLQGVVVPLDRNNVKVLSDRGRVVAVGDGVVYGGTLLPMPVDVGDIVFFDSVGYAGQFFLKPSDEIRSDLPVYLELRLGDLHGRALRPDEQEGTE